MFGKKCMKNIVLSILAAVFILGTASVGSAATQTINCISAWPKTAFETSHLLEFIENAQKEADQKYPGELKLVFKGGPEVIHTNEQIEGLRVGLVQLVLSAPSYYVSVMPEGDLLSLSEMKPWEEKAAGLHQYMDELHNKKVNAHYLGRPGTGVFFQLFLAKPIKTVADLNGMKIRVSPTNVPFMKAVGATPVQMPPSDVYTAMERGVVDGYILPAHTIRDFGLVKPSKYLVFPGAYQPVHSLLVNLDAWNKLPKHLQELLAKYTDEMTRHAFANIDKRIAEEYASFKKEGMTFIELPPAEAEKYKKIARDSMYEIVSKKSPVESEKILQFLGQKK